MTGRAAVPAEAVARWLSETPDRVILRNPDFASHIAAGGDLDALVGDLHAASRSAVTLLGPPLGVSKWSYVSGHLWQWGAIDMLSSLEWHGAEFMPSSTVFVHAIEGPGGLRQAHPAHEALICWLSKLLWGGFVKDAYRPLIIRAAVEYRAQMVTALQWAVGSRWAARMMREVDNGAPENTVKWVRPLRRAVWLRAFARAPVGTVGAWVRHWMAWIRVNTDPPLPWVAFLGLDGAGKSTVIAALLDRLQTDYWMRGVNVGHWSPGVLRRTGNGSSGPVIDPHGKPPRGAVVSMLKVGYLVADWWLGYWGSLVRRRRDWCPLLFDRYFTDMLVDRKRYRYGGPQWLASLASRLIPKPDLIVYLDLTAEEAHLRKPEIPVEEGRRLRDAYLSLVDKDSRVVSVDAARPLDRVLEDVEREIVGLCVRRTRRRMPWLGDEEY